MVFSSLEFLCVFLPLVFIIYSIVPNLKIRNAILIMASLLFYAYGEPVYVFLMIGSVLANYIFARIIAVCEKRKKLVLAAGVIVNLGVLGLFKYAGFFVENLNRIFSSEIPVPDISLPIGISFFTFQALSYIIDVYRGRVKAQTNFANVLLYISFFPQLIAGPIVKYKDIYKAIEDRKQSVRQITEGLWRFIFGLGKKVLIANTVGEAVDTIFSSSTSEINIAVAWLGAIAYMLQIYYDFSGYSDMAIGLGKMFGFQFQENFMYPYGARSIKEFWRRWHISLSTWFKEYLYIPLGGNRKGRRRACINRIIVFFCTGLWHGASWTFIIWGLWHGLFLLIEEFVPIMRKLPKVISNIYALLVVCIGFVIFRADTITQGLFFIKQMFTGISFSSGSVSLMWQQLTPWFIVMAIVGIIGAAPIRPVADKIRGIVYKTNDENNRGQIENNDVQVENSNEQTVNVKQQTILQASLSVISVILLLWCIIRLSGNTYNPFIYFRF